MPATFLRFRGPGQTKLDASLKASDIREQGKRRNRQNTNGPDCRGASCNRLLRIPRTEPHSRRRLLPHRANRLLQNTPVGLSRRAKSSKRPFKYGHRAPSRSKHELVQNRRIRRRRAKLKAHADIILDTQYHRIGNKQILM